MYTTDTLLISCGQFALMNFGHDSIEGVPSGEDVKVQKTVLTISEALAACLTQAVRERRVTIGVMDCARLLHRRPGRVMMCVLPEVAYDDVAVHIQHVLIRSFCREHNIRLLTVKDEQRLTELVSPPGEVDDTYTNCKQDTYTSCKQDTYTSCKAKDPVSCLLVEDSLDGQSEADTFVCGYHDVIKARDILPKPIIALPD